MAHKYGYAYRQERARILAGNPLCHWCRAAPATQADHEPPLSAMPPGEWEGRLVPACRRCNARRSPRHAARSRKARAGKQPGRRRGYTPF